MTDAASKSSDATKEPKTKRFNSGWRSIGGNRYYFRSRWEANIARYYQWLKEQRAIKDWEYESHTFWFSQWIKRGTVSYLPDFRIVENSGTHHWIEVKGHMDARSKTKLARMARYYPSERIIVIEKKEYYAIAKDIAKAIPEWE